MPHYSKDALAEVVRDLRKQHGWTQEELGRKAGYQTGAGVSISRLESGLLQPTPERFAAVAAALGLTTDELEARASAVPASNGHAPASAAGEAGGASPTSRRAKAPPGQKELNARRQTIEQEIAERTRAMTELGDVFNAAYDRARAGFFLRLAEVAGRVEGAPSLDPSQLGDDDLGSADLAGDRSSDHGLGAPTPSLGGADAARGAAGGVGAGPAPLGRTAGVSGRTMVLVGIVAVPFGLLAAGGLAYMVKRSRGQRQEFDAQLDEVEAHLAATRPGIEALQRILPQASATLDYIATHAGHAVDRWEAQLPSGTTTWESLGRTERRRYQDLVEVATAQIDLVNIDFQGLLITHGSDQDHLIRHAEDVLARSRDAVTSHV